MNIELLKSKIKELQGSLKIAIIDVTMKKEEIEEVIDNLNSVHLFYEKNDMHCKYDLDELFDEILFGTLEKQSKLNKVIDQTNTLIGCIDCLCCNLIKVEEKEEVIKIKEILEQCLEKIDYKHNYFWTISEYIDNVSAAQKMLEKIH